MSQTYDLKELNTLVESCVPQPGDWAKKAEVLRRERSQHILELAPQLLRLALMTEDLATAACILRNVARWCNTAAMLRVAREAGLSTLQAVWLYDFH